MGQLGNHARAFVQNLRQPQMPRGEYVAKFLRNRWRATILAKGCCGHPGEPGC